MHNFPKSFLFWPRFPRFASLLVSLAPTTGVNAPFSIHTSAHIDFSQLSATRKVLFLIGDSIGTKPKGFLSESFAFPPWQERERDMLKTKTRKYLVLIVRGECERRSGRRRVRQNFLSDVPGEAIERKLMFILGFHLTRSPVPSIRGMPYAARHHRRLIKCATQHFDRITK